ncbi:peptidylprolyl isomerase, partial [Acinetobacter baumannii]
MTNVTLQTNFGNITLTLDEEHTPITAQNFLDYVRSGFFDNTIFHRVINNFMIQ